ncbi:MAG: hypothetical protein ACRDSJ_21485, partial [Rubrobacteraceae bacterium]
MDATGDPTDKGLDLAGADGRVNAMLGVDDDGSPVLKMADEDGTVRLRLRVTVEDEAAPELVETGDERGGIRKGIASRFFRAKAVVLAAVLAFTMLFASGALAANGKPFILGKKNVATKISTLIKKGAGPALDLRVDSGSPLAVNSDEQVANLNADKVDGLDAGDFLAANGTAANSQQLEGQPASAFMQNGSSAGGSLAGTYPNPGIAAGAVGANQIASGAVNGSKIANSSVGTGQIDNTQVQERVS